MLEETVA